MSKRHVEYDTLLVVASNLTLAEVQATNQAQMVNLAVSQSLQARDIVWSIFDRHLSHLEEQLDA